MQLEQNACDFIEEKSKIISFFYIFLGEKWRERKRIGDFFSF